MTHEQKSNIDTEDGGVRTLASTAQRLRMARAASRHFLRMALRGSSETVIDLRAARSSRSGNSLFPTQGLTDEEVGPGTGGDAT